MSESKKAVETHLEAQAMIDLSPINTMMANSNGDLIYLNEKSLETLKTLAEFLPFPPEELVGKSIDIFHKNPEVQLKIIGDPKNLPHRALIDVGPEKLDLLVSPIVDNDGKYLGPMVTWEVVTQKLKIAVEQARAQQNGGEQHIGPFPREFQDNRGLEWLDFCIVFGNWN